MKTRPTECGDELPMNTQGTLAVSCRSVVKEFGDGDTRVRVLHGIDLDIAIGELTLLVGPSGCGKTTLISIIAGLLDVTDGEVSIFGQNITRMNGRDKTRFRSENVGFVFQQYNLLPSLTAAENAAIPLLIAGMPRRQAIRQATEVLERVGLKEKAQTYPAQLSGGQQQRVAFARALVHEPRLLVCDEPTAALDAKSGQVVMQLLRDVACKPGRGVIVVTHDNRVFRYGDRIVEMNDGRIDRVHAQTAMVDEVAVAQE